jgi:Methylmalonic aciduria and homocystinuria type D protein
LFRSAVLAANALEWFPALGYAMIGLQYSIHRPSPFIHHHRVDLLPDWQVSVGSLMVILQTCPVSLDETTPATEHQKRRLRRRSLRLLEALTACLHRAGYAADGFDPRTGQPFCSQPGTLTLDDVAVVQAVLGYPLVARGGCHLIQHPVWGCCVFPSVLVSEASPKALEEIARRFLEKSTYKRSSRSSRSTSR